MEQYIKIKAKNDEGKLLGTIKLSVESFPTKSMNSIVEKNN